MDTEIKYKTLQVYKALAKNWNCDEDIFHDGENHIITSKEDTFFEMITFGTNLYVYANEKIHSYCEEYLLSQKAMDIMDGEILYNIEKKLREFGCQLEGEHNRYLFCCDVTPSCPEGFIYRWFDQTSITELYDNRNFQNALNYSRDLIALGAYKDGELIALAGADDYLGEQMWQIGIDVLAPYRRQGMGVYLVNQLAKKIESMGNISYYTTWSANIASTLTALQSGFRPVWTGYYSTSTAVKVVIPAQSSILSPENILDAVNNRYGFTLNQCRLLSTGLNDIYQCQSSRDIRENWYLRVSHAKRYSRRDYEEEVEIILQLKKNNIHTCIPIQQQNGDYIWEINAPEGDRFAVLFEEVKNDYTFDPKLMGQLAASIHKISDDIKPHVSRTIIGYEQLVEHPLHTLSKVKEIAPNDLQYLKETSFEIWNNIEKTLPKEIPFYGFLHGDMHRGNVFFWEGIPQVFDFDCMGYGYRVYDISVLLWDESMGNNDFVSSKEWADYLAGYEETRQLTEQEHSLLPAFAALRQLWFIALLVDVTRINNCWEGLTESFFEEQISKFRNWVNKIHKL